MVTYDLHVPQRCNKAHLWLTNHACTLFVGKGKAQLPQARVQTPCLLFHEQRCIARRKECNGFSWLRHTQRQDGHKHVVSVNIGDVQCGASLHGKQRVFKACAHAVRKAIQLRGHKQGLYALVYILSWGAVAAAVAQRTRVPQQPPNLPFKRPMHTLLGAGGRLREGSLQKRAAFALRNAQLVCSASHVHAHRQLPVGGYGPRMPSQGGAFGALQQCA
mmetsp:Transcript_7057/g.17863  ORF Transcript_7057/g.17863 Transcript_7057/m.17863 type:complete len:218 (-) Transcript_7057:816-1469(-)